MDINDEKIVRSMIDKIKHSISDSKISDNEALRRIETILTACIFLVELEQLEEDIQKRKAAGSN